MLDAARTVVKSCDCADHDRLACHKCLLPFSPPHELDRVSRKVAVRVLEQILGVDNDAEPDQQAWLAAVTEEAPSQPVGSEESPLEKEFYAAFVERLRSIGATVKESPGTYGPSASIVLPGKKIRTWKLTPQVHMANSKPDYELSTPDPDIPRIALFADGRKYHAMPGNLNRLADDATKRAILRDSGHLVWSFGHEDLQRFKENETVTPAWLTDQVAANVMKAGNLRPAIVKLLSADPITMLLAFISDPELEAWEMVGRWLPFAFVNGSNRAKGDGDTIATAALDLLDGGKATFGNGVDMCWAYADGPLTVTATMRTGTRAMNAVVVVDDHDERIEMLDGRAWKEWLRLSNWFGLGGSIASPPGSCWSSTPVHPSKRRHQLHSALNGRKCSTPPSPTSRSNSSSHSPMPACPYPRWATKPTTATWWTSCGETTASAYWSNRTTRSFVRCPNPGGRCAHRI